MGIRSFKSADLAEIAAGRSPGRRFPADLIRVVQRKLAMLDAAIRLEDLRAPPAKLPDGWPADRVGQHSIRVNDQFRLCFVWTTAGPEDVEFVDYH